MKNTKGPKQGQMGITLIAIIITIIVLLILAGVSIAMLTGNNGILTQAKLAKEKTALAKEEEEKQLVIEELGFETGPELASNFLYYMKQNDVFNKIRGIWIGNYTHESGITLEQILLDTLGREFKGPIIKSENFGHIEQKTVIPIGVMAKIDTSEKEKIKLLENCVK